MTDVYFPTIEHARALRRAIEHYFTTTPDRRDELDEHYGAGTARLVDEACVAIVRAEVAVSPVKVPVTIMPIDAGAATEHRCPSCDSPANAVPPGNTWQCSSSTCGYRFPVR